MTIEEFVKNLEEYFSYIKTVFLNEYGKFLDSENLQRINKMTMNFKVDENLKYKILVTDKIIIGLDIESYLAENNIKNDSGLEDIKIEGRQYIKELVDGKENIYKLVFKTILRPIITTFIEKDKLIIDGKEPINMVVIVNGTIDIITDNLEKKCNLKFIRPSLSKEAAIASLLIEVMGEKNYFNFVLNGKPKQLKDEYNRQIDIIEDSCSFNELIFKMDDIYNRYIKFSNKNFLIDSLYCYQLLNYDLIVNILNERVNYNNNKNKAKIKRITSVLECLENLKLHLTILEASEIVKVNEALIETRIINNELNDKNLEQSYSKVLNIENRLTDIIERVWKKKIIHPLSYDKDNSFGFLIGNSKNEKVIESTLITDQLLQNIPINLKKNYGYIYRVDKNIIYATDKNILWKRLDESEYSNSTIKYSSDVNLLIDDQTVSKLITPYILEEKQLVNKMISGKVLLYKPQIIGVFVLYDKIDSIEYERAVDLSELEELPIVAIYVKNNNILSEYVSKEIPIKNNLPIMPKKEAKKIKINLFDNFRKLMLEDLEQEKIE